MTLCSSPAPVDVAAGQMRAAAAHWLAGSAGRLAGMRRPGWALAVWLLPGTGVCTSPCDSWYSELHAGVKSAVYDCHVCRRRGSTQ